MTAPLVPTCVLPFIFLWHLSPLSTLFSVPWYLVGVAEHSGLADSSAVTLLFAVEMFTSTLVCIWLLYIAQMCHNCPIYLPKTYTFVRPFHNELEWLFQSHTVNDVSTYHKLNRDPMMHIEKKVIDHVKRLHSLGYIPDKLKDKLRSSYSNPPGCTVRISQGPQKGYSAQTSHLKHRVTNIQVGRGTGSNPVHPDGQHRKLHEEFNWVCQQYPQPRNWR